MESGAGAAPPSGLRLPASGMLPATCLRALDVKGKVGLFESEIAKQLAVRVLLNLGIFNNFLEISIEI